jgi:hypothetical protein
MELAENGVDADPEEGDVHIFGSRSTESGTGPVVGFATYYDCLSSLVTRLGGLSVKPENLLLFIRRTISVMTTLASTTSFIYRVYPDSSSTRSRPLSLILSAIS